MTITVAEPMTQASDSANDAAAALIESNRKRRKVRKWIAICAIPFVVIALTLAGKMLSMYMFAHTSITSYVSGDAEGTVRAAEGQLVLNWFEPFIAPYNVGTGLASGTKLEDARARLEEALPQAVGSLQECAVRMNLTLVIEAQGDVANEASDPAGARTFWLDALEVLGAQPETCNTAKANEASPDRERSLKQTIDTTDIRIREKLEPPEQNGGGGDGESEQNPEGTDQPSGDSLDQIEEQLKNGAEEREDAERDEQDGNGGGGGVEKPW